jgi:hypothetical protein
MILKQPCPIGDASTVRGEAHLDGDDDAGDQGEAEDEVTHELAFEPVMHEAAHWAAPQIPDSV